MGPAAICYARRCRRDCGRPAADGKLGSTGGESAHRWVVGRRAVAGVGCSSRPAARASEWTS